MSITAIMTILAGVGVGAVIITLVSRQLIIVKQARERGKLEAKMKAVKAAEEKRSRVQKVLRKSLPTDVRDIGRLLRDR